MICEINLDHNLFNNLCYILDWCLLIIFSVDTLENIQKSQVFILTKY